MRDEVAAILAWLAGRADEAGRIGAPVQIAIGLLARVCGDDRRVVEAGKRRRATTMAIEELERLGVLTLARNYVVGRRGREWSCWYQFGSGVLPSVMEMPAPAWAALTPPQARSAAPAATPHQPRQDAPSEAMVVVRVLGERAVPEGLLRVLSDGARGVPRTLLELAPDVAASPPAAARSPVRPPWFVRMFQQRTFTPAELWEADAANVIPFPDLEARRRMTRRERLAHGTGDLAPARLFRSIQASSPSRAHSEKLSPDVAAAVSHRIFLSAPARNWIGLSWLIFSQRHFIRASRRVPSSYRAQKPMPTHVARRARRARRARSRSTS